MIVFSLMLLSGAAQERALPSAAQILERYITAIGGRPAVERLTTRIARGRLITQAGEAPLEIRQKAPGKIFRQIDSPAGGTSRNGFDGQTAWSANRSGVREMTGPEVESIKREYSLHREIRLAEFYPKLAVEGKQSVNGADAYVVAGAAAEGFPEKFYFDVQTGLLLRWDVALRGTTIESNYEDYRTVDGVKLAFRIRHVRSDGFSWTDQWEEVRHNVAIEDSAFAMPAAPSQPAAESQAPSKAPAKQRSLVPDTFTNLQVLPKDIAKQDLVAIMKSFSFTTDQRCNFCHVATDDLSEADFPSDEKEQKKKARELLRAIFAVRKERP